MRKHKMVELFGVIVENTATNVVSDLEWVQLQKSFRDSRMDTFKKHGVKVNMVKCLLTNDKGTFTVYYFKDVYQYIKHVSSIQFVNEFTAVCIMIDMLPYQINIAKKVKRKLNHNLDIVPDYFIHL